MNRAHVDSSWTPSRLSLAPLAQVVRDGRAKRLELRRELDVVAWKEMLDVVVVEPVVRDGHDPPSFGSS